MADPECLGDNARDIDADAVNGTEHGQYSITVKSVQRLILVSSIEHGPAVIPLQVTGRVDVDLSDLTSEELLSQALQNTWDDGQEGGYLIRPGSRPMRDFGRSRPDNQAAIPNADKGNLFEKAFPALYPYGVGGIEADQPTPLEFREHVQWALQYHDRRFRKHEVFPFVSFGILQRRQALASARLQMRRGDSEQLCRTIEKISADKLKQATHEEAQGLPISDPAVRHLRKHVHTGICRVMGSNQSQYQLHSQIWSTSIQKGPPSLWITINPSDLHDPIAQVLAGKEIDLDAFIATEGPDKEQRAKNIADDSYAASKFFHLIIRAVLEHLFGIKVTANQIHMAKGVLGQVAAYFGTVELQGRGTLHFHLLLWLFSTPSADQLSASFKDPEFRRRMAEFIKANIRAYLPGFETASSVKGIEKDSEVAYNRPLNLDAVNFEGECRDLETLLVCSEQIHTCKPRRCLITNRHGVLTCKRRAPFRLSEDDFVSETGDWACKRLYAYVNGWNPHVLVNVRCNNDIKLLMSGSGTRSITFYVTAYAAKKQGQNYNVSAVLEPTYLYRDSNLPAKAQHDIRYRHENFLLRLMLAITKQQELAMVMVLSYLMGWADVYRSHHYTPIYWGAFTSVLLRAFPDLGQCRR